MCDSPSFRLVKLFGNAPASTSCFDPGERLDDARVAPRQRALHERVVVLHAELLEQRLVGDVGAREGPVADALRHRRDALGLGLLDEVEEGRLVELAVRRHGDAEVGHQLGVVVDLDRRGFEREAVGALAEGPGLLGPRLDVVPVDAGRQIGEQVVVDVVGLVDLGVEDVGRLAGTQRGLERGVEGRLLVPGDLDLDARLARLEALDGVFDVGALGDLGRPVAPHRELLGEGRGRRRAQRHQEGRDARAPGLDRTHHVLSPFRCYGITLPPLTSMIWPVT